MTAMPEVSFISAYSNLVETSFFLFCIHSKQDMHTTCRRLVETLFGGGMLAGSLGIQHTVDPVFRHPSESLYSAVLAYNIP